MRTRRSRSIIFPLSLSSLSSSRSSRIDVAAARTYTPGASVRRSAALIDSSIETEESVGAGFGPGPSPVRKARDVRIIRNMLSKPWARTHAEGEEEFVAETCDGKIPDGDRAPRGADWEDGTSRQW